MFGTRQGWEEGVQEGELPPWKAPGSWSGRLSTHRKLFSVTQGTLSSYRRPDVEIPQRLPVICCGDLPKGLLAHVQTRSGVDPARPPTPRQGAPFSPGCNLDSCPLAHPSPGTLGVFVLTLLLCAGGTVGSKNETGLSIPCLHTPASGVPGMNLFCFGLLFLRL